jgi:hypothetical protein
MDWKYILALCFHRSLTLGVSLWLLCLTGSLARACWSNACIQFSELNYLFLMKKLRRQEYMALLTGNAC